MEESNEKRSQPQHDEDQPRKRQKIIENQTKYNAAMVTQTKRKQEKKQPNFKVADMVAVKIDKVDKTSPLHPNMLLGKITSIEQQKIIENQTKHNAAMVNQTKRKQEKKQPNFKVADMVAVKIDKVNFSRP